ncbi:MAG: site-specific integrase [Ignavibacteriae bacterium]|nr:MAG: site-specific integrase [Ignavibacteriota bacterium]
MASLIQRSNGFFYLVTYLNGKRIWQSTGSKTKPGAIRFLKSRKRKNKKPNNITLSQFKTQYAAFAVTNLAPSTVTLYSGAVNSFLKYCGDRNLSDYTPQLIEQYKVSHLKKVSPTKVNIDFRSLKSVFGTAVNWGLLQDNPFKRCKQLRLPQMRPIYLTPENFQKLLSVIQYDWYRDLVRFAVSTMMRVGEIVNLKWSSIDLERRLINVENTQEYHTKTRKSRVVPMNEWVYHFLIIKKRDNDKVFTFPDGKSLTVGYVSSKFTKFVRRAPIDQKIHFHSLRHTGATWLVQRDVPIFTVQHILGHSSIATTQIYSHLGVDDMRRSIGQLNNLIISSTN